MSTTWTSIISDDLDVINNDLIGAEGNSSDAEAGNNGVYFSGIMNTGSIFYFGSNSQYGISHDATSNSLEFDILNDSEMEDSTVLFNFGAGAMKIYKGGPMAIKNLTSTPDATSYDDGSIVMVNGELKIKG